MEPPFEWNVEIHLYVTLSGPSFSGHALSAPLPRFDPFLTYKSVIEIDCALQYASSSTLSLLISLHGQTPAHRSQQRLKWITLDQTA